MGAKIFSSLLSAAVLSACCGSADWVRLPDIAPGTEYGKGVSAPYCGTAGDVLIMAGGANFPDVPAADGGEKFFYDEIWGLQPGGSVWFQAGTLPFPSAYGASYCTGDRIIMAGGANDGGSHSSVWSLSFSDSRTGIRRLPDLPAAVEQGASASDGDRLYLAGGLGNGKPQTCVFCCDTASFEWEVLAELPEPLVQPVALAHENTLYVWGGYNPEKNRALDYGYAYDMSDGIWRRIAGPPDGGTLTGAAYAVMSDGRLAVCGGVDIDIFNGALTMPAEKKKEYMSQSPETYRFRPEILSFDPVSSAWEKLESSPGAARAGAGLVAVRDGIVILNGELKPGVRTPHIWHVKTAE